jgi:tetratricopeptide (TPR) repeat protein
MTSTPCRREFLRVATASAAAGSALALTSTRAFAYQGNMERALSAIEAAMASLQAATPNKGGHRERAMRLIVAWATAMGGAVAEAARLIDAEIEQATSAGAAVIYNLGLAAEVLLAANRPGDCIALLDRVLTAIEEPGVGFYLSEVYRVRGECLLAVDRKNKEEARQAFAVARDIANRQGALILARRAEASLLHYGK